MSNTTKMNDRQRELLIDIIGECRSNPALTDIVDAEHTFWRTLAIHFGTRLYVRCKFDLGEFIADCDHGRLSKEPRAKRKDPTKRRYRKLNTAFWDSKSGE